MVVETAPWVGERFRTDGVAVMICGTSCYELEGYGYFASDGLKVVEPDEEAL